MPHISNIKHILLTENVVQLLKECDIHDTVSFLEKDDDKLVNITNLTHKNIDEIRQHIFDVYNVASASGLDFYERNKQSFKYTTGILRLDAALEGGLPRGKIIELCGLPNSGKTQLALIISCNVSLKSKANIIYIDTKKDFSATRILEILKANGCSETELILCLERIKVVRIWSMNELIFFLHDVHRNESFRKSLSIIIIDSLPCLMLQHHGEKSKESIGLLNLFVNISRFLGDKYFISIIVINLITRWKELSKMEDEESTSNEIWIQKKIPTLGKYWQCIPYLYIQTEIDISQQFKLFVSIKKAFDLQYSNKIQYDFLETGLK